LEKAKPLPKRPEIPTHEIAMFDPSQPINRASFLKVATYFQGSLVIVAYIVGWLADVNPLANLSFQLDALFWGLAGTIPLYLFFLFYYHLPFGRLHTIKRFLIDRIGPLLDACHWSELLYLGLLAGFTEEVLFRGVLQPIMESHWGWAAGIVLSNVIFALVHFITPLYALLAGLTGFYLGLALDVGDDRNLLNPVFIHTFYDFLAFMAVARSYRSENGMAF
jgi:membrane protease YdiL (CAAX protease family)